MSYLNNVVKLNPKSDAYKGYDHTRNHTRNHTRSALYRLHLRKLYLQVMGAKDLDYNRRIPFEKTGKASPSHGKAKPITPWFKLLNPLKWLELSLGFLSLTVAAFAALFPKPIAYLLNGILGAPFAIARGAVGMFSSPKHTWGNSLGKSRKEHPIGFSVTIVLTLVVVAFVIATIVTGGAFFGVPLIAAAISAPLFAGLTATSSAMIGAFGITGLAASIGMGFIAAGMILRMGMSALIILDKLHNNVKFDEGSVAKDLQDAGKAVFKSVKGISRGLEGSRGDSAGKDDVLSWEKMSRPFEYTHTEHFPADPFDSPRGSKEKLTDGGFFVGREEPDSRGDKQSVTSTR